MICFTRNFEDVILQRVFSDLSNGTYIDVGASMPTHDSNTYGLYLKGWRGIAIDALPYQSSWQQARPEDLFIQAALGDKDGEQTLHVFAEAKQVTTGSEEIVKHWETGGLQPSGTITVPALTLNRVIAEHMPDHPVNLLSVDVEGMEFQVLKGLDLTVHRPWVIIVEATLPGCPVPNYEQWESCLLTADYLMAYFDGVNRFYLAREHSELLEHFGLPPNVWDDFTLFRQMELEQQITQLNKEIIDLKIKLQLKR
jgi:FkbM family methyltransferase